jgi:hypothetical protein
MPKLAFGGVYSPDCHVFQPLLFPNDVSGFTKDCQPSCIGVKDRKLQQRAQADNKAQKTS